MLPTDYVARACVVSDLMCSLMHKCEECEKEIKSLKEIDVFFASLESELAKWLNRRRVECHKMSLSNAFYIIKKRC